MSALRECPGCGSFSMPYLSKRREGVWRVACDECGFAGPVDDTEAGAIAAWNRRAGDAEVEKLRAELTAAREALANMGQGCEKLATAFRVNMLRHAPEATHAEIDRVIDACMGWPSRAALGDTP